MEKFLTSNPKLLQDNFFQTTYPKKFLFLHHTCGGNASGAVSWWNQDKTAVGAPLIIERDGSIIETFDTRYWTYALGVKGGTYMERASIHIEIVNYGKLTEKDGKFYFVASATKKYEVPADQVVTYNNPFRNATYYHKYTDAQVKSVVELVRFLEMDFGMDLKQVTPNFWQYQEGFLTKLQPGVWSHTTVRKDKSDIHPQKELIEALYRINFSDKSDL